MSNLPRFPRADYEVPAQLIASGNEHSAQGATVNISEGGLFVRTPFLLSIGSDVSCQLPLAGSMREIRGRVVWARPDGTHEIGMGIEFRAVSDDVLTDIRNVVSCISRETHDLRLAMPGVPTAIRVSAIESPTGFIVSAALPFLNIDSDIMYHMANSRQRGVARVSDVRVTICDNVTHLQVALDCPPATPCDEVEYESIEVVIDDE